MHFIAFVYQVTFYNNYSSRTGHIGPGRWIAWFIILRVCLFPFNQPVCMVKTNDRPYGHRKELHQLAVVEPAKECDLRIKDVVVGELSMYMPVYCSSHCKAPSVMGYTSVLLLVLSPPGWYGNLGTRFSGVVAETPVKENGHR